MAQATALLPRVKKNMLSACSAMGNRSLINTRQRSTNRVPLKCRVDDGMVPTLYKIFFLRQEIVDVLGLNFSAQ